MPKAFKHTGVLMMLAVVALGLIGAGYALWFEELSLNATVTTGSFDVRWSIEDANNTGTGVACVVVTTTQNCDFLGPAGTTGPYYAPGNGPVPAEKPVPTCTEALAPSGSGTDNSNDNVTAASVLKLTIDQAYPWSGCAFRIDVHNVGSTPAHFALEPVDNNGDVSGNDPYIGFHATADDPTNAAERAFCGAIGTSGSGDISTTGAAGAPVQLHQDSDPLICKIVVYLRETAVVNGETTTVPEDTTLHLSWEVVAHQWNEAVNTTNHPE